MYLSITKQNSDILIPYIDDPNSKDYQRYKTLSSGIVVSGTDIYSICHGTVLFTGKSTNNTYTVIIQYNTSQCLAYCLLSKAFVKNDDTVLAGTQIGTCNKQMRFEYLTLARNKSIWGVRLGNQTFYKQNPMPMLVDNVYDKQVVIETGYNVQTIFRSTP